MSKLHIPKIKSKPKDFSKLPWTETLRGVYPTHNALKIVERGVPLEELKDYLFAENLVDFRKSGLIVDVLKNELGIVRNDNEILFVVNIPYCECKCIDCKRNLYQRENTKDAYLYYFDALMKEISQAREIIKKKCFIVKSIYFKGNLLALDEPELEKLLSACAYTLSEVCIELGNPKFLTKSKLDIIKKFGNARFIVNALTFNTVTLRKLCRHYEFKDVYEYYKLIAMYGFDLTINLVTGLENEKELQLSRNLKLAIELGATCIDLYSRYCPNNVKDDLTDPQAIATQRRILEFANECLLNEGYKPYYLYCTEVNNGCFENIGYALPNKKCKLTEDLANQVSTILGCGAETNSVIVKNLHKTRQILPNTYDFGQYIMGIDEVLSKKSEFFK